MLVGHSLGSAISNAAIAIHPELIDAAIITGGSYYGANSAVSLAAKELRLANKARPEWADLDGGWITWVDVYANIEGCVTHFVSLRKEGRR